MISNRIRGDGTGGTQDGPTGVEGEMGEQDLGLVIDDEAQRRVPLQPGRGGHDGGGERLGKIRGSAASTDDFGRERGIRSRHEPPEKPVLPLEVPVDGRPGATGSTGNVVDRGLRNAHSSDALVGCVEEPVVWAGPERFGLPLHD